MLTPTMPPRVGARREPRQHRGRALAVEAEPVDHRLVRIRAGTAAAADCPVCGSGVTVPISTKPKPSAEQRVRHLGMLVEARRDSDRIGEVEPEGPHREPRIVGRRPPAGRNCSALMVSEWASSGSNARSNGRARRSKKPINGALRSESGGTLSAMTAFFKVGLDNRHVKAIIPMHGIIVLTPETGDRDGKRTADAQPDLDRARPAGGARRSCRRRASPSDPASIRPPSTNRSASRRTAARAGRRPSRSPRRCRRPASASNRSCR